MCLENELQDKVQDKEVCYQKLCAETQRRDELNIPGCRLLEGADNIPAGCSGYYFKGCYSCDGKNKDCDEYICLQ
ncbi:MAG: hypothetical protein PHT91_00820 [Candidatus Nanoarchaeia archaeon]|nr:hypothetical protein [Candidatus Nanoarchaeia archaeon]MDD5054031.1 hypothetical protein [Candidatus Nanoarchaeia archaeon]MDD5499402.1 hypothetical protein [Candidatus Nanoarchaeia archaeon]